MAQLGVLVESLYCCCLGFGPDMTCRERGCDGAEERGCLAFSARLLALSTMSVS